MMLDICMYAMQAHGGIRNGVDVEQTRSAVQILEFRGSGSIRE